MSNHHISALGVSPGAVAQPTGGPPLSSEILQDLEVLRNRLDDLFRRNADHIGRLAGEVKYSTPGSAEKDDPQGTLQHMKLHINDCHRLVGLLVQQSDTLAQI